MADLDIAASAVQETVLVVENARTSRYRVESIRSAEQPVPADVTASAAQETILLTGTIQSSGYRVETIRQDPGFTMPADLSASGAADLVLAATPLSAVESRFAVESIRHGFSPVQDSAYKVESIRGLPYSVTSSRFFVEAIVESTIAPPAPQTEVRWFTIVNP